MDVDGGLSSDIPQVVQQFRTFLAGTSVIRSACEANEESNSINTYSIVVGNGQTAQEEDMLDSETEDHRNRHD